MSRLRYEPALDGLRAVAVLAVMLYHADVAWLPGGFLGVDVFFSLSGWLITALLLRERAETGRIDLRGFWARRARRLLPALLLVLVAVAGYAAWLAAPVELDRIRGDGLAALLYVANWRMVFAGESYFEAFAVPSPLRHLWSLGIEEQWYLLWPLVLPVVLRWRRAVVPVLLGGAAMSALVMALLFEPDDPSRAYYGTDSRVQALLLGAVLAFVVDRSPPVVRPLGVVGLAARGVLFAVGDDTHAWLYRGGFGLTALVTVAVVAAAVAPDGPVRRVLGVAPLPAIGRISYGLYLWHWPVYVALTPSRTDLDGTALLALRFAVTFLAAGLMAVLLERPMRSGRMRFPVPAVPVAFAAVAGTMVVATIGPGVPSAPAAASRPATPPAAVDEGPARVLVVGDSVALTLSADVPLDVVDGRAEVTSEAILGCGVIRVNRHAGPLVHEPAEDCLTWPARWAAAVERLKPDVAMLLIGAWEVFDIQLDGERVPFAAPRHEELLADELVRALGVLGAGRTQVLVLTVPCYSHFDDAHFRDGSERNEATRVAWINDMLRASAAGREDTRVVEFGELLCPGGDYRESLDGVRVRRDDGTHLAPEGLGLLWQELLPEVLSATQRARSVGQQHSATDRGRASG